MIGSKTLVGELNARSLEIFRRIVDGYVQTGEPMGSRTLARLLNDQLSPASVRTVMADLEDAGLLYSPHTSAGRLPTDAGLRFFVDGLLEIGDPEIEQRALIDAQCQAAGKSMEDALSQAIGALSGLSGTAGLVVAPKTEAPLKHIEIVNLGPGRALVVIVAENGVVENRVIETPLGLPPSALVEATNYLNHLLAGKTLAEAKTVIENEQKKQQAQVDELTAKVVEAGVASWAGGIQGASLIVRGQSHLLDDVHAEADLERIRMLFDALETKERVLKLLDTVNDADGVQIYIGAESNLFDLTGCSMIVAPYRNKDEHIIGAIGVIGPTRLNYARIIPLVDYTSKVIGRLIG